ncbi:hypothetical protein [Nannocystis pusilla]|uniref:hypothetical protein n=1 Tax=Nannocystis pusilla TaxID=889268 RepID=UPI003B7CA726
MSIHSQNLWSLALLVGSTLVFGCDEEFEASFEDPAQEVAARDLSLCATVPAHETVTLAGPGTYSVHAPNSVMGQTGCDNRFVVDFDKWSVGAVQVTDDLHHFTWTSASWAYPTESSCITAHAVMDVYVMNVPYTSFTKIGTYDSRVNGRTARATPRARGPYPAADPDLGRQDPARHARLEDGLRAAHRPHRGSRDRRGALTARVPGRYDPCRERATSGGHDGIQRPVTPFRLSPIAPWRLLRNLRRLAQVPLPCADVPCGRGVDGLEVATRKTLEATRL